MKDQDSNGILKTHSILVVDDDEDMLELIKITLERIEEFDLDVVTTSDPKSALKLLESGDFDMILSDHRMPGMSGIELLSKVREKFPDIIRAMVTAYSELELARDAINRAKVDLYIEKPWTRDKIKEDIKEVLTGLDIVKDAEVELKDGNAYLFKEKKSNIVFDAGLERMRSFGEGLIITRTNPKKIKQIYDLDELSVDVYWLSKMGGEKTLDPVNLELIADMIIRYYEGGGKTVILDGIDSLLKDNSFKRFEGFIDNIVDVVSIEEGAFLTGLDPKIISERKLATIENKLTSLSFDQTR